MVGGLDHMVHDGFDTRVAPSAVGPYVQAITHNDVVYASGCIPLNPTSMTVVEGGVEAQAKQALGNLSKVLEASGSSMQDTIKTTCLLKNMEDFVAFNKVYEDAFAPHKPARSCFEVARLPKDILVEVEAIAASALSIVRDALQLSSSQLHQALLTTTGRLLHGDSTQCFLCTYSLLLYIEENLRASSLALIDVMPICVYCQYTLTHAATMYSDVDMRVELCPRCSRLVDPYIGKRNISLLADLVVLKPGVLRHLLFNRLSQVAFSERYKSVVRGRAGEHNAHAHARTSTAITPRLQLFRLGGILVLADAFVQWVHSLTPLSGISATSHTSFLSFLFRAFVDAVAYHIGVILAVRCLHPKYPTLSLPSTQISLAILYSSFAKLFLLLLLVIADPSGGAERTDKRVGMPNDFLSYSTLTDPTKHSVWLIFSALDDESIDRAYVVNTVVGGMSAGFGLRVLLNTPPITTTLIILAGWLVRSVALYCLI
ncbi:hypothetical protein E3P84_03516 [Wallemia ichthyophaga]|nr:hypothetical protein E3P84_03516 [Wallemia ichthyophaga]TIB39504.1 hypothetical protein E3P83_03442 [Wallemia ichthyophaga]